MNLLRRAYRGDLDFDFVERRRRWLVVSAVVLMAAVLSLGLRGLNLGIEFRGGVSLQVENSSGVSVGEVRQAISGAGLGEAKVQSARDLAGHETIRVETRELTAAQQDILREVVAGLAGGEVGEFEGVSASFGARVIAISLRALLLFLAAVTVYIAIRLELKMALVALVALVHDLVFTAGVYSLVGLEVTPETMIAVLTILGYSLYDTVVVFDKVIENVSESGDRQTYSSLVNRSLNQVIMRSINTSLTTLLPVGSLLFVGSFLLGATTLRQFALALFIGVAVGTYSSMFVAGPLLVAWKEREEHWTRVRRRVERRLDVGAPARVEPEAPAAPRQSDFATGAVARPPKKRRRHR